MVDVFVTTIQVKKLNFAGHPETPQVPDPTQSPFQEWPVLV